MGYTGVLRRLQITSRYGRFAARDSSWFEPFHVLLPNLAPEPDHHCCFDEDHENCQNKETTHIRILTSEHERQHPVFGVGR